MRSFSSSWRSRLPPPTCSFWPPGSGEPENAEPASGARPATSVSANPDSPAPRMRALIVSSFVLPRAGGVEQFVDVAARLLRAERWHVRVLACRPPTGEAQADATVPARFLGSAGW